jgi:hypothetical protein
VNFGSAAIATSIPRQIQLTFMLDTAGTIGALAVLTHLHGGHTGLSLSPVSGAGSSSGTATVAPGAAANFTIALAPGGSATYPDPVTFSALGFPPGATATFTPATIPADSGATSVTLTIQTSSQTARNEKLFPGGPFAPMALGFLLLPLAGLKSDGSSDCDGSVFGRFTGFERLRRRRCYPNPN